MIFRIMLQFAARYNGVAPRKNLHIIRRYAKLVIVIKICTSFLKSVHLCENLYTFSKSVHLFQNLCTFMKIRAPLYLNI